MDQTRVEKLLEQVRDGRIPVGEAKAALAALPELDLGHTRLDTQRELRCGFGEVIFGAGKEPDELVEIARVHLAHQDRLLITRTAAQAAESVTAAFPAARYHSRSGTITVGLPAPRSGVGEVLVVSAGTSDASVAEEAVLTARMLGARVDQLRDVGVAGVHRLLREEERLRAARVLVVVAGMEGALPSVVGGLVSAPVIAVPTSVGYGASLGGIAALLGMLNSCAAGVTVVNIDNGFGAGFAAARINALAGQPL